MENDMILPVSVEKFAAYLDGNLSDKEMRDIDALISSDPDMEELVSVSDEVDKDLDIYLQDEFGLDADMTALDNSDFDIPNLDNVFFPPVEDNEEFSVASASSADPPSEEDNIFVSFGNNEIIAAETVDGDDLFVNPISDDSFEAINGNHSENPDDLIINDDFLNDEC